MAESFTDHGESQVAKWAFTDEAVTRPTEWWLALHTADPTEAGNVGEVTGDGYARKQITPSAEAGGLVTNANIVVFGPSVEPWGTITHASIWDSAAGGNAWAKEELDNSKTVGTNDTVTFNIGEVKMRVR